MPKTSLPDTKETLPWGKPHFRVGEKIFAGYDEHGGRGSIVFQLSVPHAVELVEKDPR